MINKLKTMLFVLLATIGTSTAMAGSSDHSGMYFGVSGSAAGVELDGSQATSADDVGETTTGTIGKVALIAGLEIGYALPMGDTMLLDVGATYTSGEAKISTTNNDTAATADVTFEVTDLYSVYIAPTFAISDTSAFYFKLGFAEASTSTTGDVTQAGDLEGTTYAFGARTQLASGLFIRTEAGITDYNELSVTGKGEGGAGKTIGTGTTIKADPTIAYGAVSVGFKF